MPQQGTLQGDISYEYSVMIKGQAIGVICFTCFNQKQRSHALKNQEIFKQFLQQFADLISAKAQEALENKKNLAMKELLETIVDRLDAGVIVMDQHNLVVQTNRMCCQILKMRRGIYSRSRSALAPTGNFVGGLDEYRLTADNPATGWLARYLDWIQRVG